MSYQFCSKFHTLSKSAKNFENPLTFDKVTESLKVGTFLRHSVDLYALDCCDSLHSELYTLLQIVNSIKIVYRILLFGGLLHERRVVNRKMYYEL